MAVVCVHFRVMKGLYEVVPVEVSASEIGCHHSEHLVVLNPISLVGRGISVEVGHLVHIQPNPRKFNFRVELIKHRAPIVASIGVQEVYEGG